jgi:hypothetical protein
MDSTVKTLYVVSNVTDRENTMTKFFIACALGFVLQGSYAYSEAKAIEPGVMLATAKASPEAVESQNRQAWLELFTDEARIEDPVGAPPLQRQGRSDPIFSHFYETFIASTQIQFIGHGDYFSGSIILRDVDIRTDISTDCGVTVPAFVTYDIQSIPEGPRIAGLRAFWELSSNVAQLAAQPLACAGPSLALSKRMLKELGPQYSLGYSKALLSVGQGGQRVLRDLAGEITRKDQSRFLKHFSQDAQVHCSPDGEAQTADQFWDEVLRLQSAWVPGTKMLSAGRFTVGQIQWMNQDSSQDTVIQVSFDKNSLKVTALRCFFPIPELTE